MADLLAKLSESGREKAEKTSMPEWMDPMLAKLTHEHFSSEDWIYERKLDGERVIAYVASGGAARLMSRNKKDISENYPEVVRALEEHAPAGCILDGEVVAFNSQGVSDFQRLQGRMQSGGEADDDLRIFYYLFDCMYVDGHDVTGCAQRERKTLLRAAVDWNEPLRFTPHRNAEGETYFEEACRKGWEGLIAKRADAPYVHSRSKKWLKFKCENRQELIICGWTEPKGSRIGFGALLLGYYSDGDLVYAGEVGTGFDDETLRDLHRRLARIERDSSPFDRGDVPTKEVHFATPKLVGEVAFTEWTRDGRLRHPRFKGLRRDKSAEEVRREG